MRTTITPSILLSTACVHALTITVPTDSPTFQGAIDSALDGDTVVDSGAPGLEDAIYDSHPRWPDWFADGVRFDMGAYGGPANGYWLGAGSR